MSEQILKRDPGASFNTRAQKGAGKRQMNNAGEKEAWSHKLGISQSFLGEKGELHAGACEFLKLNSSHMSYLRLLRT